MAALGTSTSTTKTKNRLTAAKYAVVMLAIVNPAEGMAQMDQAITTKDLVEPWDRARAVLLSLAHSLDSFDEVHKRQLDRELGALDAQLSELQSQEEDVAIGIVSKPEFAYVAPASSHQLWKQVAQIGMSLTALFCGSTICQRPDVLGVQESVDTLRRDLSEKNGLERDVLQALGSGSRNEIQALAARWWEGSESVGKLREAVASLRRALALPGSVEGQH